MFLKTLKQKAYEKRLQGEKVPQLFRDLFAQIKELDTRMLIRDMPFVIIDTETTGLKPEKGDSLLSIAGVGFIQGRVDLSRSFYEFIRPERKIPHESVVVHHLTPAKMHNNAMAAEQDVLRRFFRFCGSDMLVGHHVSFDVRMLNHALEKHFDIVIANRVVDTALLARAIREIDNPVRTTVEEPQHIGLDELAKGLDISMPDRHDAYGDAFATALVLQRQIGVLEKKGVKTLKELIKLGGIG